MHRWRVSVVLGLALCSVLAGVAGAAESEFPFDRDLLLDAAPMRPNKHLPGLNVRQDGAAQIDLWCRSVAARIEIGEGSITIAAENLTENLPPMISEGQCTPARIAADEVMLAAIAQATSWRRDGSFLVLAGGRTLRFMVGTN